MSHPSYPSAPFHDTWMPVSSYVIILRWKELLPRVPGNSLGKEVIAFVSLSHGHPNYNSSKHFPNLACDVTSFTGQIP